MIAGKLGTNDHVDVFKSLQKYGEVPLRKLAVFAEKSIKVVRTARKIFSQNELYENRAMPKLSKFPELPFQILSIQKTLPHEVENLKNFVEGRTEVRAFFQGDQDVVIIMMHKSRIELSELTNDILKNLGDVSNATATSIYQPAIINCDLTIPDEILDALYKKPT